MDETPSRSDGQDGDSDGLVVPDPERYPVLLSEVFGVVQERPVPSVLSVDGDPRGLFYRGKSNSLAGEPGRGKTLMAQWAGRVEVAQGGACLFLDYEKDLSTFQHRMQALGLTESDAVRVAYMSPTQPVHTLLGVLVPFCVRHGVSLVVIDSVSRALSRIGPHASENDNNWVRTWYDTSVDPFVRAGITVLVIDHLAKAESNPTSDGRFAKGAGAKLDVITGGAWIMRVAQVFTAEEAGCARLAVAKDNNGAWPEGGDVTLHVVPDAAASTVALHLTLGTAPGSFKRRPTAAVEAVRTVLAQVGVALSRSAIARETGLKDVVVAEAVDLLIAEGAAVEEPGPRGARLTRLVGSTDNQDDGPKLF